MQQMQRRRARVKQHRQQPRLWPGIIRAEVPEGLGVNTRVDHSAPATAAAACQPQESQQAVSALS